MIHGSSEQLQKLTAIIRATLLGQWSLRRRRRVPEPWQSAQRLEQRIVLHQPHDPMLAVAISPDFETDGEVLAIDEARQIVRSIDGGRTWSVIADPLISRPVTTLAYSPAYSSDQIVFAGTSSDGIYRSTDGGQSWTQAITGMRDFHVRTIAFSPEFGSDQTVYVGTQAGSIFRSVDGGDNWQWISGSLRGPIVDIEVSPNFAVDRTVVVAQFGNGAHRSNNAGNTFFPVNGGLASPQIQALALPGDFASSGRILAGTSGGIFLSTTGGNSWSNVSLGLSDLNIVDVDFTSDGREMAVAATAGVHLRMTPQSWTRITTGIREFDQANGGHYADIALSSTFGSDNTAFVATFGGLYRLERTAPVLWVEAGVIAYRYNREVQISPDFATDQTIFAATYGGGLMKSTTAGDDWSVLSRGMANVYIDNIAVSPNYAVDQTLFSGNFLGVFKSTDGGQTWSLFRLRPDLLEDIYVRDLEVSPNFTLDRTLLAGASTETIAGLNGVYHSTDGGQTWATSNTGLPANPRVDQIEFSPNFATDRTVYVGVRDHGVYRSTDGGLTWSAANGGIATSTLSRLRISPTFAADQMLFGVSASGLVRSTDGGANWIVMDTSVVPGVTAVTISPNYAADHTVWIGAGPFGVFRSTDGGQTWNGGSTGLEGVYINDIVASPDFAADGTLIVGTSHGAHRSTDGGDSFEFIQTLNRYEDEPDLMSFQGSWNVERRPDLSGPTRRWSSTAGATVEFEFYGSQISWIGSKGPNHGRARVTLDGQVVGVIDLYDPVAQASTLIGTANLQNGWHTVTIAVLGTRRAASTGTRVSIDAFDVVETA